MTNIESLKKIDFDEFSDMFADYFINYCESNKSKETLKRVLVHGVILRQYENEIVHIDVAKHNDRLKGFIIYQIDSEKSDWNERPGMGFIREFFVCEHSQKRGIGSALLASAEERLQKLGAKGVYLTSGEREHVKHFYVARGYETDHTRATNGNEYFEKTL